MIVANVELALALIALGVAAIGTIIVLGVQKSRKDAAVFLVFFLSLSLIGAAIGYLSGISRVGVAGDVLPAALVFLGAGAAYVFSLDRTKGVVAAVGIGCFSTVLFHSYYQSGVVRSEGEAKAKQIELQIQEHFTVLEACLEFVLDEKYFTLGDAEKAVVTRICSGDMRPGALIPPKVGSIFD